MVKELTDSTWLELLVRARLQTACHHLRHSDDTVAEVALCCGFGDQSSFHRTFKHRFGLTPGEYRKQVESG